MKKFVLTVLTAGLVLTFAGTGTAQKNAKRYGKICGDPTVKCGPTANFEASDLAFDTGKNFVIAESAPFYGIVLKSKKMSGSVDCTDRTFSEAERLEIQRLFPNNKVFSLNCSEPGTNYYTGVSQDAVFIAVYAGDTLAEANSFLKTVKANGRFAGIRVRKMRAGINGT